MVQEADRSLSPQDSNTQELQNRTARRNARKNPLSRQGTEIIQDFQASSLNLQKRIQEWNTELDLHKDSIHELALGDKPVADSLLSASKSASQAAYALRQKALSNTHIQIGNLAEIEPVIVYRRKVKDTSFEDIENMQSPLSDEDIKRITKMLGSESYRLFVRRRTQDSHAKNLLSLFAVQTQNKNGNGIVSSNLNLLHRNVQNYFDVQLTDLMEAGFNEESYQRLMNTILRTGGFTLQTLAMYIPVRLDITPGSAKKVFESFAEMGDGIFDLPAKKIWKRYVNSSQIDSIFNFLPASKHIFPQDLKEFIFPNQKNDKEASKEVSYWIKSRTNTQDQIAMHETAVQIPAQLKSIQKAVHKEIFAKSNGRIIHTEPNHPLVDNITITHSSKNTLIFIVKIKGSNSHLTLDVTNAGQLYGIPFDLRKEFPHIEDFVWTNILQPFIKTSKEKYNPVLAPINLNTWKQEKIEKRSRQIREPKVAEPIPTRQRQTNTPSPVADVKGYLMETIDTNIAESTQKTRFIAHTREQIVKMLGKKIQEKDINDIMNGIKKAELGAIGIKALEGLREPRYSIRTAGHKRIILVPLGNNNFSIEAVGFRKNIFRNYLSGTN